MTRYLERSEIERRYDGRSLAAAMTRANGRRGLKLLVTALNLGHHLRPQGTRSAPEELLLFVVREGDFGEVRMNHWMPVGDRWIMADAWFPERGLVIEIDSRWHDTAGARERDADRDADTTSAGVRVVRLRKRDISHDRVAAELARGWQPNTGHSPILECRPYASAPSSRSTRRRIASDEAYVESIP
jgi:very-short-patch-repair endonuclease